MLSNTINPALGIEDSRLRSLPFEIIGFSNLTTIRLPSDPAFSLFKHNRQLLLRLKWMFDALHFARFDSTKVLKVPNLERSVALRLFLRLLKLCSSESIENVSTADYHIWRYLALESILSGMQVMISELQELDQDEEDLIEEEIQKVATTWNSTYKLTTTEECLLEQILPNSGGHCYYNDVKLHRMSQGTVESMAIDITTAINAQTLQPAGFWRLYKTVSETICYLTVPTSDRLDTFGPAHAQFILKAATDKLKSSNLEPEPVAIVQHQLKRLSFAIEQMQPSSTELEVRFVH